MLGGGEGRYGENGERRIGTVGDRFRERDQRASRHGEECHCLLAPLLLPPPFFSSFPLSSSVGMTGGPTLTSTDSKKLAIAPMEHSVCCVYVRVQLFLLHVIKMPPENRVFQVSWQLHTWQSATSLPSFSLCVCGK